MKALVIGSEGNVGGPLVVHLRNQGYDVLESDIRPGWTDRYLMADINHPIDLLPAFDWQPDVVFLLSAMVSRVTCEQAAGLAATTNLAGVNNVIQLCKRAKARLVFFSTSEVYGPACDPMDEAISDPQPNNRYGLTKLLGEKLVEYEVRTHGLRAIILRPFMIYDENEDIGDHRSAMIRFAWRLASGMPIEVHRGAARGWMHISDAIHAIEAAARIEDCSIVNIGHPDIQPIDRLAETIRAQLNAPPELVKICDFPAQMTQVKRPALNRQRVLLGVEPRISLEEGIQLVCRAILTRTASQFR